MRSYGIAHCVTLFTCGITCLAACQDEILRRSVILGCAWVRGGSIGWVLAASAFNNNIYLSWPATMRKKGNATRLQPSTLAKGVPTNTTIKRKLRRGDPCFKHRVSS